MPWLNTLLRARDFITGLLKINKSPRKVATLQQLSWPKGVIHFRLFLN